jgi:hypothetical protein
MNAVTKKLTLIPKNHPTEDVFESYAFDRLSGMETADFEEHLLICEKCQTKFAQTDEYVRLMKAATSAYVTEHRDSAPHFLHGRGLRRNAATAAILVLTGLAALVSWRAPLGEPKTVVLNAYRGAASEAPAGKPLDLVMDLKDVRPAAGYRVEIVDATGQRVWFGGTPARLTKGLLPGVYWVRLATDAGEPLREFGLTAVKVEVSCTYR